MADKNYPHEDEESNNQSITQEYHDERFEDTNLGEFNFEFSSENVTFRPMYYPKRVKVGKERDLNRESGICQGEHVTDSGTKNREVHVVGYVTPYVDPELQADTLGASGSIEVDVENSSQYSNNMQSFHDMCDFGERGDIITMQWSGEVLLKDSDIEGPKGIDTNTGHFLYEYTLDFVSTGRDETPEATTGIVNDGISGVEVNDEDLTSDGQTLEE